ncbi:MAG TPA: glycosyltransferase family 39 protein [Isosphaeraceae bacterium]|jgi:hypothetical protein|nr:glycosyltransferase family 39 protein [Isosphaeraceae bacterium]
MNGLSGPRWWWACGLVLVAALIATVPTTGDIGLTWDEPAYRYSQILSAEWWEQWTQLRSWSDVEAQLDAETLFYYWPYARHGINFHPPLAGQLNLLTHTLFGTFMKDIPSRRMSSVIEYAVTITILFGFLTRRYGAWVGGVAAASLLLMPRVYGDGHIAGTDTPGLLLWAGTAVAAWKGLYEENARAWRILVGVLLGLAFVEKMGAVLVLGPILVWLLAGHLPRAFLERGCRAAWVDGLLTTAAMLLPLGVAFREIRRLAHLLPEPQFTDLFVHRPPSPLPGAILLLPLAIWVARRIVGRLRLTHPIWGVERPALEIWTAILAFAPAIGWLSNPAWWRETLPRLAHYYVLNSARRGSLPDIQILYFGQTYEYSLPWHNAWVLIAITVPTGILFASIVGLLFTLVRMRVDRLPIYFLIHLAALPIIRMFETPAHDGVRLLLPTFFFLAAFAGWGTIWVADSLGWLVRMKAVWFRSALAALVLGTAAWQLIKVHPFELSYYNELIGGPSGAWHSGFELAYWYDAFNDETLAKLNSPGVLPPDPTITFSSDLSTPPTFEELRSLGKLRSDIRMDAPANGFPYMWLLTHDSKASAFTRLLFEMTPGFFAVRPPQLDRLRVATVADAKAVSRAWALWLLTDAPDDSPPDPPAAPAWVRRRAPWLGRLWGDGVTKVHRLAINEPIFDWARNNPERLVTAARAIASGHSDPGDPDVCRLMCILTRYDGPAKGRRFSESLLRNRPEALVEAVQILITHPDAVRTVLLRYPYTDPAMVQGYLDRDFPRGGG